MGMVVQASQCNECCVGGGCAVACTKSNLQLAASLDAALTATVLHVWGAGGSSTTKLTPPSLGKSIDCLVVSCGPAQAPLKNPNEAMMTIWPAFPLSSGMPAGIQMCEHTRCRKIRIPNNEPTQTSFEPRPISSRVLGTLSLGGLRLPFAWREGAGVDGITEAS